MKVTREASVGAETQGLLLGMVAVSIFSLTLPATRVAVAELDPVFVGLGRGVVAALFAIGYLLVSRAPLPARSEWRGLAIVAAGVVVGFPLFSALAMRDLPAVHGGVMLAILPLATAIAGAVYAHERPPAKFWLLSLAGASAVVAFALREGGGNFQFADLLLVAAVVCAAVGYAVGARLTPRLGGLAVISWALVLTAPFVVIPVALASPNATAPSFEAWFGFAYVSLASQFLGFVPWYRGLALGGIARVSQLQLAQPFLTVFASAWLLGEGLDLTTIGFAVLVVLLVGFSTAAYRFDNNGMKK
jgi:drug/metabolite transporter (DMT)-like permease